jgi:nucleoside phosphorylase
MSYSYIAIIAPWDPEYIAVKNSFDSKPSEVINNGLRLSFGNINGRYCILCQSGVNMVNASRATEYLITNFGKPLYILVIGTAGGSYNTSFGQIIVPHSFVNHGDQMWINFDYPGLKTLLDDRRLPGYYCYSCQDKSDSQYCKEPNRFLLPNYILHQNGTTETIYNYDIDITLYNKIRSLSLPDYIKFGGIGISGPIFLTDFNYFSYINNLLNGQLRTVDMETAAIAHVCKIYNIPILAFRMITVSQNMTPEDKKVMEDPLNNISFWKLTDLCRRII